MAFSISCADAGLKQCPASFTTETRPELMEHIQLHAQRAHPDLKLDPQTQQKIEGLIRTR